MALDNFFEPSTNITAFNSALLQVLSEKARRNHVTISTKLKANACSLTSPHLCISPYLYIYTSLSLTPDSQSTPCLAYCLLSSSTMDSTKIANGEERVYQNVVVMRHGERLDNFDLTWAEEAPRPWDPPLVEEGKVRAFFTGRRLRSQLGFRIHRVFVSPFLRCVQTASEVVSALCALDEEADRSNVDSDGLQIDASKIKVSIELGLCEMLNKSAIRPNVAPKDGKFGFNISELEAMLPAGTVDHSVERVYQELPQWEETSIDARNRYSKIIKALADKFPSENLLLVTHGEGVRVSVSELMKNVEVYGVHYCAYLHSRRSISYGGNKSFTAGDFEVPMTKAQTGVIYGLLSTIEDDHLA